MACDYAREPTLALPPFLSRSTLTDSSPHPVFTRLRSDPRPRPLVAAHRGDSRNHPENTLAAYRRAAELGVAIQEFDVRELACGALVCVHDATFDRTSNATKLLGPGAMVAHLTRDTVAKLDAGAWHPGGKLGEPVPTLAQALAVMVSRGVPLIEHKSGSATCYVDFLRDQRLAGEVILQSFDWQFLAEVHHQAPEIAIAALGPNHLFELPSSEAIAHIRTLGAGMIHWQATSLHKADVERAHRAGLLVCSYTTDDELGWLGGQALGLDAMCTNDPAAMSLALQLPGSGQAALGEG